MEKTITELGAELYKASAAAQQAWTAYLKAAGEKEDAENTYSTAYLARKKARMQTQRNHRRVTPA